MSTLLGNATKPTWGNEISGVNTLNQGAVAVTLPAGGPYTIESGGFWGRARTADVSTRVVLWSAAGAVLAESATFTMTWAADDKANSLAWEAAFTTPPSVAGGTTVWIGLYRNPTGKQQFALYSSGTHYDKTNTAGFPGAVTMSGATTDSTHAFSAYLYYSLTNTVPNAPTINSVAGAASGSTITDLTPDVIFTHSDPDSDPVTSWDLQVDTTSNNLVEPDWASLFYDGINQTTGIVGNVVTKTLATVARGQWYAVRARTADAVGDGPWSATFWFIVTNLPTIGTRSPLASALAYINNLGETAVWSPTAQAAKPRFTFVYNDADGHASSKFRLRLYLASSGGAAISGTDVDVTRVAAAGSTITYDPTASAYAMHNANGITPVNLTQGSSSTDAATYTTASVTMEAGRLYLLSVENSHGTTATALTTPTGGAGVPTFVSRSTTQFNGTLNRTSIWSAAPATDYTGTLTINFVGAVVQTGATWSIDEFSGADTTTSDGIVQQAVGTGTSGTALATLAAFTGSNNTTFGAHGHAGATATAPGSGFTELADQTAATPAQALQTEYRLSTDTTVDATFTSVAWGACAVEIQMAERWWTVEAWCSAGETTGESSRTAFKVKWGQGLYEFNAGATSSAWGFSNPGTAAGTQAAFIYRSATGTGGAGANSWQTAIGSVAIQAWVNVCARLATYTAGTNPSLTDMTFSYSGSASTPDRWTGTPGAEWALDLDTKRFGAKSLKCSVASGTTGNRILKPFRKTAGDDVFVSKLTQYTFSAFIKTTTVLTGGDLRLQIGRSGSDTDLITPTVASPVVTDTSTYPDGWRRISLTFTTESSDTVRPMLLYTRNTGVNESFFTDAWKMEEGAVATAWTPGFVGAPVILDANGIQVDAVAGGIFRLRGSAGSNRDVVELATNGLMWGGDTEVSSPAAGELKLLPTAAQDKTLTIETASARLALLKMQVTGDTGARATLRGDATQAALLLGPGNAVPDIYLRRTAAKTLTLDSDGAGTALTKVALVGAAALEFGGDVSLSRTAANEATLATGDRIKKDFIGAIAQRTATQVLTTGVWGAVAFNAADIADFAAFHDTVTNNTRIIIPTGFAGTYMVAYIAGVAASAAAITAAGIAKNGAGVAAPTNYEAHAGIAGTVHWFQGTAGPMELAVADYIELMVFQNSGGNLNTAFCQLAIYYVGETI